MINVLFKNQLRMLKNSIRTARLQTIIGTFIAVVFIGIFIVFIGRFIWRFSEQITVNVLEGLLGFGFVIVFALVILMGLGQVFKSLFDSSDLEMLFAMPIPTKSIFWMKFIQSYFSTALFMFVVMIVPMYIYGLDRKSTCLNSSHVASSYAVFCLKKKKLTTYSSRRAATCCSALLAI